MDDGKLSDRIEDDGEITDVLPMVTGVTKEEEDDVDA